MKCEGENLVFYKSLVTEWNLFWEIYSLFKYLYT